MLIRCPFYCPYKSQHCQTDVILLVVREITRMKKVQFIINLGMCKSSIGDKFNSPFEDLFVLGLVILICDSKKQLLTWTMLKNQDIPISYQYVANNFALYEFQEPINSGSYLSKHDVRFIYFIIYIPFLNMHLIFYLFAKLNFSSLRWFLLF